MNDVHIVLRAQPSRYKGKRARRQAFAYRQRLQRLLNRLLRHVEAKSADVMTEAHLDALVHGISWVQAQPDGNWRGIDVNTTRL